MQVGLQRAEINSTIAEYANQPLLNCFEHVMVAAIAHLLGFGKVAFAQICHELCHIEALRKEARRQLLDVNLDASTRHVRRVELRDGQAGLATRASQTHELGYREER